MHPDPNVPHIGNEYLSPIFKAFTENPLNPRHLQVLFGDVPLVHEGAEDIDGTDIAWRPFRPRSPTPKKNWTHQNGVGKFHLKKLFLRKSWGESTQS